MCLKKKKPAWKRFFSRERRRLRRITLDIPFMHPCKRQGAATTGAAVTLLYKMARPNMKYLQQYISHPPSSSFRPRGPAMVFKRSCCYCCCLVKDHYYTNGSRMVHKQTCFFGGPTILESSHLTSSQQIHHQMEDLRHVNS